MVRRLLLAAALLAALILTPARADAADFDFAACDYMNLSATGSWAPGLTPLSTPQAFSLSVQASCTGQGDEAGNWTMSFSGTGNESCYEGSGNGSVNGSNSTSGETWTLSFTYQRSGMFLNVNAGPGGAEGDVATLVLYAPALINCPTSTAAFRGMAAVADTTPPPGPTALQVNASGVVSPGLTPPPLAYPVTWSMSGTATGTVNSLPAQCSFAAHGIGAAIGMATESGTGGLDCSTPGGTLVSCPSFSYQRVGSIMSVSGTCPAPAPGLLAGQFTLAYTNANPATMFTAAGGLTIT